MELHLYCHATSISKFSHSMHVLFRRLEVHKIYCEIISRYTRIRIPNIVDPIVSQDISQHNKMLASNAIKRGHGQQKINVEANEINFDVKSKPLHVASASLCISHSRWLRRCILNRVRPRLFDQDGHETMYASSRSVHFFTKL